MAAILVVDDDPNARLLLRTLLTHAGHRVIEAANGAEGLSAAARDRPDLIVLDLSMPSMGGAEFVRALRSDPHCGSSSVALYTATMMSAALRDFMEIYGVRHVIPKPSEPLELLAAVERALAA
jgi:CheY-like chemotaxis protein